MEILGRNGINEPTYFLLQGQSIVYLHKLMSKNASLYFIGRWTSIVLELLLYLLAIIVFILVVMLPNDLFSIEIVVDANNNLRISTWALLIKIVLALIPLLAIALARLLNRYRKEKQLNRTAFEIIETMRDRFAEMKDAL